MLVVGVLVSGSGTNLQAILDACAAGTIDARVGLVVSNRPAAGALERAARAGVPTRVIDHREFADRGTFETEVVAALRAAGASLVVLAGFDRLVTRVLLDAFPLRVLNIHPALLPAFPGLHAQRQAHEYGVRIAGATVHFVDEHLDHGPIILQGAVGVSPDDTPDDVRARILTIEHRLYPAAIQLIATGRVHVEGRRVRITPPLPPLPEPLLPLLA